jgi:hypothetical protein
MKEKKPYGGSHERSMKEKIHMGLITVYILLKKSSGKP